MVIRLGNTNPVDNITGRPVDGPCTTTIHTPDGATAAQVLADITALWPHHSSSPTPAWVTSDDAALTDYLAAEWCCPTFQEDAC